MAQTTHPCLSKEAQPSPGIYATKEKYRNQKAEAGFISVGAKYVDPAKRFAVGARYKGKQFTTRPLLDKSGGQGYMEAAYVKQPHVFGQYVDKDGYRTKQPLDQRKLGFASHDAARRDEFMSYIRTRQYREQLTAEKKLMDKQQSAPAVEAGRALLQKGLQTPEKGFPQGLKECTYLYDIGRSLNTAFDPKSNRDTFYNAIMSPSRVRSDRRTGGQYLSSAEYGQGIDASTMGHPAHGHAHATKAFFDQSHLQVGSPL